MIKQLLYDCPVICTVAPLSVFSVDESVLCIAASLACVIRIDKLILSMIIHRI